MGLRFSLSAKSWAAFVLCAAVLLLFAFIAMREFRKETVTEEAPTLTPQAQAPRPENNSAPSRPEGPAPETVTHDLVVAWNRGDAKTIAGLFTPDGVLIIPTGSEIRSRGEINKMISEQQSGMLKETTLKNTVEDVSLDGDTAVVKGTYRLDDIELLGFHSSASGSYILRQTRQDGRWMIAQAKVLGK